MRLARRPGAFVAFIDTFTAQTFLKFECDADGLISFHLFDGHHRLVAGSNGARIFPGGLQVSCLDGEQLLFLPPERDESIQYRLYNLKGALVTWSDGKRTQIYGGVRIQGNRHLPDAPL